MTNRERNQRMMVRPAETTASRAQIATLTMNPALDITTSVDTVRPTDKLRCGTTRYDPGGGGINVARVAHVLGESVSAVFPAGGPTGDLVMSLLGDSAVPYRPVAIAGATRESFTVNENSSGQQYRFVLPGPRLTFAEQAQCLDQLRIAAESAEFVVVSGSLPPGVPPYYYQRVAEMCRQLDARLILDTSGGGLQHISSGVYLLKASVRELRECVGLPLTTEAEQFAACRCIGSSSTSTGLPTTMCCWASQWKKPGCETPASRRSSVGARGRTIRRLPAKGIAGLSPTSIAGWLVGDIAIRTLRWSRWESTAPSWSIWPTTVKRCSW